MKPGDDGHDEQAVAQSGSKSSGNPASTWRSAQLELLGYHDSGMPDWEYKDRPDAFCNVPQSVVAGRIGGADRAVPAAGRGHL